MPNPSDNIDLTGKTAVVTGANTGIGKSTALELARRGARVILACRSQDTAEQAVEDICHELSIEDDGQQVFWRHLDLTSLESVRCFASSTVSSEDNLHILVNNAAVLPPSQRKLTNDGRFELTFATNHLGHFLLTNLLLPLLKKSAPSRIVVVSSVGYKMCRRLGGYNIEDPQYELKPDSYEPWMAYCQTKLANIMMARQWAEKLQGSGVSVFSVHPGTVKTDIFRHRSMKFTLFCGPVVFVIGKSPEKGAKPVVYCATEPGIEDKSGAYFAGFQAEQLEDFATDDDMAARLWTLSEKLTNLGEESNCI